MDGVLPGFVLQQTAVAARFRVCVLCALILVASTARADDVHYNDYPVGNRALGLGGAFTGLANDPSGVYYNPAGLVGTTRTNVSVSTSLYGLESTSPSGLNHINITNLDLNVIPGEVGGTYAIGDIKPGERAKAAWGFDVAVPSFRQSSYHQTQMAPNATLNDTHSQSDQTLWAGIGGAYSIRKWVSVGLSAFYLHRTQQVNDHTTALTTDGGYSDVTTAINVFDDSVLFIGGVQFELNDKWNLGAMLMSPSVHVRSGGTVEISRVQWTGAGGANATQQDQLADTTANSNSLKVVTASNGGFRVGGAYTHSKNFTLSADISGNFPVSYQRLQFQNPELLAGITQPINVQREMVVNFAVGGEWRFLEHLSVAGGFYTDFSSAPPLHPGPGGVLPSNEGRDALPRTNLYGGSIAIGYFGEHSLTRLGFTAVTGWGQNVQFEALQNTWLVQPLRETLAYVFVASTFRY